MTNITVDILKPSITYDRSFQKCVGSCHAYLALREDYRQHLRRIQKEIGFKYIRFHGIFLDWVGIYNETRDGEVYYNFQNADKIFDFLLETGIKPFVEFSFMPEKLASGREICFKYKCNVTPPKDYILWNNLIKEFVTHYQERYGIEELITWRFEVWNEPDLSAFWTGSMKEYFYLYKNTALTVKSVDKRLKVGGPATSEHKWIAEMLEFCREEKVPLDFISTHTYNTDSALDMDGKGTTVFRSRNEFIKRIKEKTVDLVHNSVFSDIEIHYTEWNVTPVHEDAYGKDSEYNPVFVLEAVKECVGLLDSFSYWTFSDIFEESGPGLYPFSGKYGLLSIHGIKKPSFHAFKYMSSMYDQEIPVDGSVRVTKSHYGEFRVLAWNVPEVRATDFTGKEWEVEGETRKEAILLENIQGEFRIRGYCMDSVNGNSFRAWKSLGSPQYPDKDMLDKLSAAAEPLCFVDKIETVNGVLKLEHQLGPCSIVFYNIEKV